MAVQNTREDRSKSKKRRAELDQKFMESTLGTLEGLQMAMDSVNLPETLGQSSDNAGRVRTDEVILNPSEEVNEDITTWTQEQPKTFFQRLQDPQKPEYNQERADKLKKVQLAKGLSEALGSIGKLALRQNQGIAGENGDVTGQWLTNEINFLEDDYLRQMADYQNNLARTHQYNNQLANAEKEMILQEQIRTEEALAALDRFKKEQGLTREQNAAKRELEWKIANLRAKSQGRGFDLEQERISNLNYTNSKDLLNNQGRNLTERRKQLIKQISESVDDKQIEGFMNEVNEIDQELKAVNEAYGQLTGATYTPEPLEQPQNIGGQMLLQQVLQQQQNPSRSAQIDNAVSEKPVEKPNNRAQEVIEQTDNLLQSVIQSKKVNRDNLRTLINAFQDRAEASGQEFDKQGFIDYLKSEGVEVNLAKDDLNKILSSIDNLFTREKQDNIANR